MADNNNIFSTAVPPVTITEEGITVPLEMDMLQGRLTDMSNALGNASKELSSPQGQIAVSDTAILNDRNNKLLILFNQINPDFAQGRFQDGIGRFYFIERNAGKGTVVTARCYGRTGTVIPALSRVQDINGNMYHSTFDGTISLLGYVDIQFSNLKEGPISCSIGDLNTIYTPISGWDRITNETVGVLGNYTENTASFEARRRDSVALNSRNTNQSILGALLEVNDVIDAYIWSNREKEAVKVGSTQVMVDANATYICVSGGDSKDIAEAIVRKYNPSGNMMGDTNYIWQDTSYNQPYPEYKITWQTAKPTNIYFKVTLSNKAGQRPTTPDRIKQTIIDVFTGRYESATYSGRARERIGGRISSSRYYSPVISIDPASVSLNSVEISLSTGGKFSGNVEVGIDQVPAISADNIQIDYTD